MSTDTPTPERATLSDEEREAIDATLADVAGSVLPMAMRRTIERILAAREQALREEIAGDIEEENGSFGVSEDPYGGEYDRGVHEGLTNATRIARGGTR